MEQLQNVFQNFIHDSDRRLVDQLIVSQIREGNAHKLYKWTLQFLTSAEGIKTA